MRVLFSMRHLGSFRLYESVLRRLAANGHEIRILANRRDSLGWGDTPAVLLPDVPQIQWNWEETHPTAWLEFATAVRIWQDYLRYFEPTYQATPRLRSRAAERVPALLRWVTHSCLSAPAARRAFAGVLRTVERALPYQAALDTLVELHRPDLVMLTPLLHLGSPQIELLRSARARGVKTALCVGSWDHLSSKALIRDMPHRVLVWNETQKDEAVRLHGVPPERVVVTGAQCYDQWFGRQPVRSRDVFCHRVGLQADRPYLLYVCSALFWGSPVEAEFVRRWVQQLRESAHPELRSVGVLIRPHPARMDEWKEIDLSPFEGVALYGSNPMDDASKDDYFESLFYSRAVVGLNTSAFLEGAIVGRPAHTILLPEFHENQEGTLHFHYLFTVGGGVLVAGRSFQEHHAHLVASLQLPAGRPGANPEFVRQFIRPQGLDTPTTPTFCDAVEDLLAVTVPAPERTAPQFVLLRWAMGPAFQLLRRVYGAEVLRDDWSRKEHEQQRRRDARECARQGRRDVAQRERQERDRRRAAKLTTRQAAHRAAEVVRQRDEAEKARRKRDRARQKAAHARRRGRAAMRARLKQGASRWLSRWRTGRQNA